LFNHNKLIDVFPCPYLYDDLSANNVCPRGGGNNPGLRTLSCPYEQQADPTHMGANLYFHLTIHRLRVSS
jgi:hypothetical protein